MKYFAYCGDMGFETFETKEEAMKFAKESIEGFKEDAFDYGWNDEVSNTCWGEIKQETAQCNIMSKSDAKKEGIIISDDADYFCDYELIDCDEFNSKQDITVMSKLILKWWQVELNENERYIDLAIENIEKPEFVKMSEKHLKQESVVKGG